MPQTSALVANPGVPTVTMTEEGPTINDGERTFAFTEDELGAHPNPSLSGAYYRATDEGDQLFLIPRTANDRNVYDYMSLWTWLAGTTDDEGNNRDYHTVHFVNGTPTSEMPVTGTASYDGRMNAESYPKSAERISGFSPTTLRWYGRFTMMAEFGAEGTAVTGAFDRIHEYDGTTSSSNATPLEGTVTFEMSGSGSTVSGSGFAGDGPFSGYEDVSIRAGFFGPDAVEVGGVFDGQNAERILNGYIRAKKSE